MSNCTNGCYNATLQVISKLKGNNEYSPLIPPNLDFTTDVTVNVDFALAKTLELVRILPYRDNLLKEG